ncbi:MAG: acyl-CoA dehydrogenase family protein [Candidatus Latescibacteria bacterium]|nr:acyl-CoA dehydrogenase family protein [Candidatus Latescibacterota bacterium]
MSIFSLSEEDSASLKNFRDYVDEVIFPCSNEWEENESIPDDILNDFADRGFMGAFIPKAWGGMGMNNLRFGLFCAELARGSVSLLSILTVHNMTSQAILRWGTEEQKKRWLPRLSKGVIRAAFALTEPEIGSDASNITTRAVPQGGTYILNGAKKWISFSTKADLILVIAQYPEKGPAAFLVERQAPGLSITPMKGLLGFRAAEVGEVTFNDCKVGTDSLLANPGGGFTYVASHALDHGRYCVGWGGTGVIRGCVEACTEYTRTRHQFGRALRSHQLIQAMVADMATDLEAATSLAMRAADSRETMEPESIMLSSISKYFTSKAALRAATDAVQIHGGNGCGPDYPVQRYYRDAKVCEIIEGSSQMQQLMISREVFTGALVRRQRRRQRDVR